MQLAHLSRSRGRREMVTVDRCAQRRRLACSSTSSRACRTLFARFEFAQLGGDGPQLPPLTRQAFVSMCRDIGVRAALAAFRGKAGARRVRAFWRGRQAHWWAPEDLWADACAALRGVGLFPGEAFEVDDGEQAE